MLVLNHFVVELLDSGDFGLLSFGDLDEDQSNTLIMYIGGQCRGQTNAAKTLINS